MADHPKPGPAEIEIGLEHFLTTTAPLGGVLRKEISDFVVDEISDPPKNVENGPITIAKIKARNWETNRLVRFFSKNLGISRQKIKFAGTKDKRAVTTRLFSFQHPENEIASIDIPDVEVLSTYTSNRELELGILIGNSFKITVREIEGSEDHIKELVTDCLDQIISTGGFPDFFGIQRFGAVRPITHIVGKHIVNDDIEKAVMAYVGQPRGNESQEAFYARDRIEKERDWDEAVDYYPPKFSFERTMIHHMRRRSDDWAGAISSLPDNLKMMFIHAYQSYIFNRILSKRIEKQIPLNSPIEGDIILAMTKKGQPEHYNGTKVTSSNLSMMEELVKKGKGFISGAIIGMNSQFASGEMGEIEASIIEEEKITPENFNIIKIPKISSKGMRRELLSPLFDLKWRILKEEKENSLQIGFSLFRGTYATSFMREIIKGNILDY